MERWKSTAKWDIIFGLIHRSEIEVKFYYFRHKKRNCKKGWGVSGAGLSWIRGGKQQNMHHIGDLDSSIDTGKKKSKYT